MKKQVVLLLLMAACMIGARAQETKAQRELLEKMSDETCIELQAIDLEEPMSKQVLTAKLGRALMPSFEKHGDEIKKEFMLDVSKPADAKTVGEKLGMKMVYSCDKMLKITQMMMQDKEFREDVKSNMKGNHKTEVITGSIKKTEAEDFYCVYFNTENDDLLKLTVLFPVSEPELMDEVLKGKCKKQLKISYYVAEVYSAKEKAFKPMKVISGIEAVK